MDFIGETFSVACAFVWAIGVVYFRKAGDHAPPQEMNLFKNSVAGLLLLITFLLWPNSTIANLDLKEWGLLILSAFIGISLADTLLLKAVQIIGAGRYAIVECLYSPCVILLSFLFLGEKLTWVMWLGILLVIAGILVCSFQKTYRTVDPSKLKTGMIIGILSPVFIAIGIVMVKPILEDSSALEVTTIRTISGAIGNILWLTVTGRISGVKQRMTGTIRWSSLLFATLLGSYFAPLLWIAGFKYTQASVASVLNQTSVFFIIVFSTLVLKEQMTRNKLLGALLGFSGAVLIVSL